MRPKATTRNELQSIGDEAMRAALLQVLRATGWSLAATARHFGMKASVTVLRAIRALGLTEEYERAKAAGLVRPGPREQA